MDYVTMLGFFAACLTTGAFVPQVIKTWKSGSASDLSLGMFSMIFFGTICWLIYGFLIDQLPIIIANAVVILLSSIILYFKLVKN